MASARYEDYGKARRIAVQRLFLSGHVEKMSSGRILRATRVRAEAKPVQKIRVCSSLHSDCFRLTGVCYLLGSAAGYVSIGSAIYTTIYSPSNFGNILTSGFLMISYALKLGYYRDKHLAFWINASLGVLWCMALINAIAWFATSR